MLWICRSCTCRYSVSAPRCPQCGADNHYDEGDDEDVPKIRADGKVTDRNNPEEVVEAESPSEEAEQSEKVEEVQPAAPSTKSTSPVKKAVKKAVSRSDGA